MELLPDDESAPVRGPVTEARAPSAATAPPVRPRRPARLGSALRVACGVALVACVLLAPSQRAQAFLWNCQTATQAPGLGSDGPVTFTFSGAGQGTTVAAFTCEDIDHSVNSIPGGVPPQLPFAPGPQGIDAQELLALAGVPWGARAEVLGMQISCVGNLFSYAAGDKRPGQPVSLTPSQIALTGADAVFIEPNDVAGVSWFVDPTKPDDSGANWFSCLNGWAITIDTAKAPSLVVPTPLASPTASAAGAQVSFSLPSGVTTSTGGVVSPSSLEYSWSFGDRTAPTPYGPQPTATHVYAQPGSFSAAVSVEDRKGDYGLSAPVTVTVSPPAITVATPSASPSSAATTGVVTGTPVAFATSVGLNGSPDPDSLTYRWGFGDGGTSTAASPTYSYRQPGSYAVSVSVTDASVGGPRGTTVTSATLLVQVNAASGLTVAQPTFSPGTPLGGQPVALSVASVSLNGAPDSDALSYQWTFGDGSPPQTTAVPTTAYTYACQPTGACFGNASAMTFKLTVTVTDATAGLSATSPPLVLTVSGSGTLVVSAPTVNPTSVTLGGPVQFTAPTATLNGGQDSNGLRYQWSFSDGGSSAVASPSYTFTQAGQMTATVTVTDAAGNTGTSPPTTVQVDAPRRPGTRAQSARPQTITFTSTAPGDATVGGPAYAVAASASSGLPVTLTIDPSASSVCSLSGSSVRFTGTGPCVIDANQAGDVGTLPAPQAQQSFAVTVRSPLVVSAPSATVSAGQTVLLGPPSSVTLNGSPDANGLTYAWTLGDGTTATGPAPTHRYSASGSVQVSVTVTDAAGNSGTSPTITVQVGQSAPSGAGIGASERTGNGGATGPGSGGGSGNGAGAGVSSGSGASTSPGAATSPLSPGGTAAATASTPTPTQPATTTAPAATTAPAVRSRPVSRTHAPTPSTRRPKHHARPARPRTNPKRRVAPTRPTPHGLVGYLIQPPSTQPARQRPVATHARSTTPARPRPVAATAAGGGGGGVTRTTNLEWLLGVLLVIMVVLLGAGLEIKPVGRRRAHGPTGP